MNCRVHWPDITRVKLNFKMSECKYKIAGKCSGMLGFEVFGYVLVLFSVRESYMSLVRVTAAF